MTNPARGIVVSSLLRGPGYTERLVHEEPGYFGDPAEIGLYIGTVGLVIDRLREAGATDDALHGILINRYATLRLLVYGGRTDTPRRVREAAQGIDRLLGRVSREALFAAIEAVRAERVSLFADAPVTVAALREAIRRTAQRREPGDVTVAEGQIGLEKKRKLIGHAKTTGEVVEMVLRKAQPVLQSLQPKDRSGPQSIVITLENGVTVEINATPRHGQPSNEILSVSILLPGGGAGDVKFLVEID